MSSSQTGTTAGICIATNNMSGEGEISGRRGRTRDGCWTCRDRKKKCDSTESPCGNCRKLGLSCDRMMRLVWEEDTRRVGMKRRGAAKRAKGEAKRPSAPSLNASTSRIEHPDGLVVDGFEDLGAQSFSTGNSGDAGSVSVEDCQVLEEPSTVEQLFRHQRISFPHALGSTESLLLDHYIGRFSRTYPTFSAPTNPFLSVLVPIAMQSRMVLDSLLTLSGARIWDYGWSSMERETLKLRQRALSGCRKLLERYSSDEWTINSTVQPMQQRPTMTPAQDLDATDLLYLLTSSTLFLLYDMLMGDGSFTPHLEFIGRLFKRHSHTFTEGAQKNSTASEAFRFLHNLFLYNDLVMSTSLRVPTASDFYVRASSRASESPSLHGTAHEQRSRYYFPSLIARVSAMDTTVTEADIEAWDGNLDWLPSFSLVEFHEAEGRTSFLDAIPGAGTLTASTSEYQRDREIITQLYRVTASIYRRQSLGGSSDSITADAESSSSLASLAIQLIHHLPQGSPYENALLWPIGICGRELTSYHAWERQYTIFRLQLLEKRFRMKHFQRAQQVLANNWRRKDQEAVHEFVAGSHWQRDMILLG